MEGGADCMSEGVCFGRANCKHVLRLAAWVRCQ